MAPSPAARIAIVTGASAGIGLHTALGLARGAGDRRSGSQRITALLADFASLAAVRQLAETILAEHPRIDVLINNAG